MQKLWISPPGGWRWLQRGSQPTKAMRLSAGARARPEPASCLSRTRRHLELTCSDTCPASLPPWRAAGGKAGTRRQALSLQPLVGPVACPSQQPAWPQPSAASREQSAGWGLPRVSTPPGLQAEAALLAQATAGHGWGGGSGCFCKTPEWPCPPPPAILLGCPATLYGRGGSGHGLPGALCSLEAGGLYLPACP